MCAMFCLCVYLYINVISGFYNLKFKVGCINIISHLIVPHVGLIKQANLLLTNILLIKNVTNCTSHV